MHGRVPVKMPGIAELISGENLRGLAVNAP